MARGPSDRADSGSDLPGVPPAAAPHTVRVPTNIQVWERITFLHWRFAPEVIQARLPDGLRVDVRDGSAWVGMTPFCIRVRPGGVPFVPRPRCSRRRTCGPTSPAPTGPRPFGSCTWRCPHAGSSRRCACSACRTSTARWSPRRCRRDRVPLTGRRAAARRPRRRRGAGRTSRAGHRRAARTVPDATLERVPRGRSTPVADAGRTRTVGASCGNRGALRGRRHVRCSRTTMSRAFTPGPFLRRRHRSDRSPSTRRTPGLPGGLVVETGVDPVTPRFSGVCSAN